MKNKYRLYSKEVDAIYSNNTNNKLIDALPDPFTSHSDIDEHYSKPIDFNRNDVLKMNEFERIYNIANLSQLRLPLPFQRDIEEKFYISLYESYIKRKLGKFNGEYKLKGSVAGSSNEGFAMLGYSGCGKSSTLDILLSRYPRVIKHEINGDIFCQIPYIVVSCISNSNFNVLYQSIGNAIDEILNTNVYEELIKREKKLGNKMKKVEDFIEKFAIGAIVLDEIQNIDFTANKENSYEGLLTISNDTKVAICVVGTEDAYEKMFINLRNSRRAGRLIPASSYCSNKYFYQFILEEIFKYQWTDEKTKATDDIVEAFYKSTKGIIALTITLYQAVQKVCIDNKLSMSPEIIESTAKECFSYLDKIDGDINDPYVQKQLEKVDKESRRLINKKLKEARKADEEYLSEHKQKEIDNLVREIRNFIKDYTPEEIKNVVIELSKSYTGDKLKTEAIKMLTKSKRFKAINDVTLKAALSSSFQ